MQEAGGGGPVPKGYLAWFGSSREDVGQEVRGDEQEGFNHRRRIFFSDLRAETTGNEERTRTRIKIDRKRGAAEEGALLMIEAPYASGEEIVFAGSIDFVGKDVEIPQMVSALRLALNWASQAGGLRTIGFGRILKAEIGAPEPARSPLPAAENAERLALVLRFRDPVCVAETRNSGNTYVSSDVIPGGVIKGALANLITMGEGSGAGVDVRQSKSFPALAEYFSHLRVSHLFPAPIDNPRRPYRWNKSLVVDKDDRFHDAALWDGPQLIGGRAPAFFNDWKGKHFAAAERCVGWPHVPKRLRVRTSIHYDEVRAKHEGLFAYEMLEVGKHVWVGEIGLEDIATKDKRAALAADLARALADGLPGIGRSQSFATLAEGSFAPSVNAVTAVDDAALFVLTLQTPALLRTPEQSYAAAIRELCGGALKYVRHFASERLSGANFMANRYFKNKEYRPWLLTEPGSVFVLQPSGMDDPAGVIRSITTKGLPLPESVRTFYGLGSGTDDAQLWPHCPYIRQNGYGEITVASFSKG